jgi:hypothetical protein
VADTALDLTGLLRELGFDSPDAAQRARDVLVAAKLTTPTKSRIDAAKRPRVEAVLREKLFVTCGTLACVQQASGREPLTADQPVHCWVCAGSSNLRAIQASDEAFQRASIRKIVIVGGSPSVHDELRQLAPKRWELRLINGTDRRTSDLAQADVRWADLILIWGSSELDHKVSTLYAKKENGKDNVVLVNRRGIAALLEAAIRHARGR